MLEAVVLVAFCAELVACVALGAPIVLALFVGLVLFVGYGLARGHRPGALARMGLSGIATARGVLTAFVLIGVLTASWRACGTVAEIVMLAAPLVVPAAAPLAIFLLCGLMSFLTGTSFGTSATMGVVCMTMARSMGANELFAGGAVLAGAYFGDRCSPMSTSALLVRTLTRTDLPGNFRAMLRSAAVPFALALVVYAVGGFATASGAGAAEVAGASGSGGSVEVLAAYFDQGVVALLPAVPVLVLPLLRVDVKVAMAASIVLAAAVCVGAHGMGAGELLSCAVWGFAPDDASVAALMSGGGLVSMVNVVLIVCLSSSYAGIFQGTGLLEGVRGGIAALARKATPFGAVLAVSVPASMVACNQTLGIMLAHQLCAEVEPDARKLALDLEDSAVVVSPLVPWSIACSAVVTMCAAPDGCWLTAVYLWFIPLWHLAVALVRKARSNRRAARGVAEPCRA